MQLDVRKVRECWAAAIGERTACASAAKGIREVERWCAELEVRQAEWQGAVAAQDDKRAAEVKAHGIDTLCGALRILAAQSDIDISEAEVPAMSVFAATGAVGSISEGDRDSVRSDLPILIGTHVQAMWCDAWHPGVVYKELDAGCCKIRWDEDGSVSDIPLRDVCPSATQSSCARLPKQQVCDSKGHGVLVGGKHHRDSEHWSDTAGTDRERAWHEQGGVAQGVGLDKGKSQDSHAPHQGIVKCTLSVLAPIAEIVRSSLVAANFTDCHGNTYVHARCQLTVEVGQALHIYIAGIDADDVAEWARLQLEHAPATFGARILEWVTAQRSVVPGFIDTAASASGEAMKQLGATGTGFELLPSAHDLRVDTSRVLHIYTWGRALREGPPSDSQWNFNASVLNGRGGAANLRFDNGLSEVVQRNVASCGIFPTWLRFVTSRIESSAFKTVSINCTKGRHRSVAAAEILRKRYYPRATVEHMTIY
mmetsp:Transcript_34846/g.75748  ORF Transcript_34846/g.75748 Transcript_34846/m.75748 type:complete len:481 (+) Transcript_34846:160-1602(+)